VTVLGHVSGLVSGVFDGLLGVSIGALAIAIVLHLVKVGAEARAWHGILSHSYRDMRFRVTFGAFAGALGANAFLPGKIGEALRLGIVRRRTRDSCSSTIAATMVLETAIETVFSCAVIAVVLVAGQSVGVLGTPAHGFAQAGAHRTVTYAVALGLLLAVVAGVRYRVRVRRLLADMARGFAIVREPRRLLHSVMTWKLAGWALRLATVYWFLVAFHIAATPWTVLLVIAAQVAGALIPILPGNAGAQQAALVVALAGAANAGDVVAFGVGMQAATGLADILVGTLAVGLVASRTEVRAAFGMRRASRFARA
jgi:uncharacterized membrane protein YbhN (UPF0104 family)